MFMSEHHHWKYDKGTDDLQTVQRTILLINIGVLYPVKCNSITKVPGCVIAISSMFGSKMFTIILSH